MVAAERVKTRHDQPGEIPIPDDLPPGTKATIIGPDEQVVVANERKKLDDPIIYRSIYHPDLKMFGSLIVRPHPMQPGKFVQYRLPTIAFYNTYLRVEYEDENQRVLDRMNRYHFFVEPTRPDGGQWDDKDPNAPHRFDYVTDEGRVIFSTRNPQCFQAFEKRMRS